MVPKPDTGRAGIVLAGGRSTRFGGADKATASLGGEPMIRRVVDAVAPAVDDVVVNCRDDQRSALAAALPERAVTFATDAFLDRGPAAGLRTGLQTTEAEYAAVVACDMPFVPSGFLNFLFARARHRTGAVPTFDGAVQPLPSVVHVRAATTASTEALTERAGRLSDVIDALDPRVVSERVVRAHVGDDAFRNVNTWEDLRAAGERL